MQYCTKCGASMLDDAVFCSTCGQRTDGTPAPKVQSGTYPSDQVKRKQQDSIAPAVLSSAGNKHAVVWGVGIVVMLLVAGIVTFFATQITKPAPASQYTQKNETKNPAAAYPSQGLPGVMPSPPVSAGALADFRVYVQAKERINSEIIDLASQINTRLSQSGTLRYSQDLRSRARLIIDDITRHSAALSARNYPLEFQGSKSLLLQLFDLETTRARSLYNGVTEGLNGQDFQSSFSVGTRAAYEFDDMNARFVQEYSSVDRL